MKFRFSQALLLSLIIAGISHASTSFAADYSITIHSNDNRSTNNSRGFFTWLYSGLTASAHFVYEEGFRKCFKGTRQSKARQNLERIFPLPDPNDIESGLPIETKEPLLSSNTDSDADSNINSDTSMSASVNSDSGIGTNMSPSVSTPRNSDASICSDVIAGRPTLPTPAPTEVLITLQNVLKRTEEPQQEIQNQDRTEVAELDPDVLFPVPSIEEAARQYMEELRASRARTKAYSKLMKNKRNQLPQIPEIATSGTALENSHVFAEQINNPQLEHYGSPEMVEPAPKSIQPVDDANDQNADSDYIMISF